MLRCSHCEHSEVPKGSDFDPLENLGRYYWKDFFLLLVLGFLFVWGFFFLLFVSYSFN